MRRPAFLGFAIVLMLAPAVIARTWYIAPNGTGDAPNIQAGIDSATAGDTVLVSCGIYYESGIHMRSGVVLLGDTTEGDSAIIDAQERFNVLNCAGCDGTTIIEGLTIKNGKREDWYPTQGGGMDLASCYLTIRRCVFSENKASYGAAVFAFGGQVAIEDCIFTKNYAGEGAAIFISYMNMTIRSCTFVGNYSDKGTVFIQSYRGSQILDCTFYANEAGSGSGIYCADFSSPTIGRTVFCGGLRGHPVSCGYASAPVLGCCDIYGNMGGDWVGCVADQFGVNGNFSADPGFCDAEGGDFFLEECSPCLPGNHPDGVYCWGTIGAHEAECACTGPIRSSTWGGIKSMYR